MTEYGGHARHMVKGSREQGIAALEPAACSGVLVIGGDGTVCEVKLVCMSWLLRLLCRPLVCMVRGSAELRHLGVRCCGMLLCSAVACCSAQHSMVRCHSIVTWSDAAA